MARTVKNRQVCAEPVSRAFSPQGGSDCRVILTVEALEALRLCDLEGLDQDIAAARMNVSRGTLQRILYAARRATADALVGGKTLVIEGGSYVVVGCRRPRGEGCRHCPFQHCEKEFQKDG